MLDLARRSISAEDLPTFGKTSIRANHFRPGMEVIKGTSRIKVLLMDTVGNAYLFEVMLNLTATGGPLDIAGPVKLHLAQAPFTPGANLSPGDITEADYTGYAAIDVTTWGPVHQLPNANVAQVANPLFQFKPTGTTITNTIAGWLLEDGAHNTVACGSITPPKLMASPADVIILAIGVATAPYVYQSTQLS